MLIRARIFRADNRWICMHKEDVKMIISETITIRGRRYLVPFMIVTILYQPLIH